ncbi:MAG: efflux RND transporter periplasmic adaptor subunit [Kofleriaceae bacterium]
MRLAPFVIIIAIVAAACGSKSTDPGESKPAEHAVEDGAMCKEHGIAEAICTKCNPKLIPVFKAKGDWCEEHGFPESACPICHPERGGQPAAGVAEDGAPPDGAKVCLKSKDVANKVGIETVKAQERPEGVGLVATATLTFDATKRAVVNARSPGVVRAIQADLGAKVSKGSPLASIDSAGVGADRSRLQGARSRVSAAEINYQREKDLQAKGISSAKTVLDAQQELDAAKAEYASIASALGMVGQSGGGNSYTLASPIAGQVVKRHATIGTMVGVEQTLFEIVDTSNMWVEIDVPEDEVPNVALGQRVLVTVDGIRERQFEGQIAYISPEVDSRTRTAMARAALANPDGVLRANMFAQARIVLGGSRSTVTVPAIAVQRAKDVVFAFVQTKDDEFEVRRVQLGAREDKLVEVTKGIKPGENVVATGSFILKTETLKDSIGDGCTDD